METSAQIRFSMCGDESVLVVLDAAVYRLSAIKKATYKFGGLFHTLISTKNTGFVEVTLKSKEKRADLEFLAGQFCNEVLDQDLREDIAEKTDAVRNLLLAHALSRTSLVDRELESTDYREDPLGIASTQKQTD
jgi:His-Xaa-Ser system protein HxsD